MDESIAAVSSEGYFLTYYPDNADSSICKSILGAKTADQKFPEDFR